MSLHAALSSRIKNKDLLADGGGSFVNGEWIKTSSTGKTFDVINPSNLETLATLPDCGKVETEQAIKAAYDTFKTFKKTTGRERGKLLRRWAELCYENKEDLAMITALENGKTLNDARGEVLYSASFLEWFAGEAERQYGSFIPSSNPNMRIITVQQPVGVAACLAPWNFPIAMITRKVGAALAAGCTTVWKPAGETPFSAIAQIQLAKQAGFPIGTINMISSLTTVQEVGLELSTNKLVKKLSFTGSTRVGKLLMAQCAGSIKKLSLELGGNSPFIVFDDADIKVAVDACIMAKFRNSGQTCVSANRIFVQDGVYDKFAEALKERVQKLRIGPGYEEGFEVSALTHERAVEKAMRHVEDAVKLGGKVIHGGKPASELTGYYMNPTIITGMTIDMQVTREETFAPVSALYRFHTEEEVMELANDSEVGLGGYVCTSSIGRMWRVAENIETGMVGVNAGILSACESPFGGVKESGKKVLNFLKGSSHCHYC